VKTHPMILPAPRSYNTAMTSFQTRWHALAFMAAALLCALCVYWEWRGAPVRAGGTLLALKALPLALCLLGLWRGTLYVLQMVSMLVLLYMAEGVIRGMGDTGASQYYAWGEFTLSWLCFFGCILHVRPYKKEFKQQQKDAQP
jgi:uncharacterized membrane protein